MKILKKLKTARSALVSRGPSEVLKLLKMNIELYSMRYIRLIGSKLRRATRLIEITHKQNREGRIKILYVTNRMEVEDGQTVRYRIYNLRKTLPDYVQTRFEIIENGVFNDTCCIEWADIVVLLRTDWTPKVDCLIHIAKRAGVPVVFDIDDILFLQDYVDKFCTILQGDFEKNKEIYKNKFYKYGQTFQSADFATTSTVFITDKMKENGKKAFVIHNGLSSKQIAISESLNKDTEKKIRYIGYLSGTYTHNQDFLVALPALEKILEEYEDVCLRIVGYLDMSLLKPSMALKTETLTFIKWDKLLKVCAENFVNIAPLDISNPFCHAKSELKYFEAAIVGVPTVASSTDTFKRCITHGVNGMLASSTDEWYTCIKGLLDDRQLYKNIQKNAYEQAVESYSPQTVAKEALIAYQGILREYRS